MSIVVFDLAVAFIGLWLFNSNIYAQEKECLSSSTRYQLTYANGSVLESMKNFSEVEFIAECHISFVEELLNKSCREHETTEVIPNKHPTTAQKYGYGFLSVFIISALSLAGFLAFRCMNKPYYQNINAFFTSVAVGTLLGDTTGWMIIVGDGIHNVADGLAIGAAFSQDILFGVTTAIAIACHELPTELGEYMVLIESGFTRKKALLFNFISACTAMIGFFIGVSISQNDYIRVWIFAITLGTFLYIALVDLVRIVIHFIN
ncbi:unnamed protein product [Didymodactylos carnosus]|uniref:Uncharacterized protein n=1 Tax=Didymodactylos carnosus TaxID=1234261 RepID=A0A814Y513_9BILA|nr:unnamed protein product [Didymodactylos carnosus]CAF3988319.1 unnamed protein product [Didymodactylos carnosus]